MEFIKQHVEKEKLPERHGIRRTRRSNKTIAPIQRIKCEVCGEDWLPTVRDPKELEGRYVTLECLNCLIKNREK